MSRDCEAIIFDAWAALGTTEEDASDDPETADLADSIRISLHYERDQAQLAAETMRAALAERDRYRAALEHIALATPGRCDWCGDDHAHETVTWRCPVAIARRALGDEGGEGK